MAICGDKERRISTRIYFETCQNFAQATKNPFYLHVGRDIVDSLERLTRAPCGYATVHSVLDMSLEDRMESFFLAETCKYLYLVSVQSGG